MTSCYAEGFHSWQRCVTKSESQQIIQGTCEFLIIPHRQVLLHSVISEHVHDQTYFNSLCVPVIPVVLSCFKMF